MSRTADREYAPDRRKRRLLGGIGLTLGGIGVLAGPLLVIGFALSAFGNQLCGNIVVKRLPSPDGRLEAVVFGRSCGATTGASTQVSLLPAGKALPNKSGNCFVADTYPGSASCQGGGNCPPIDVSWSGPRSIRLTYPSHARLYETEKSVLVWVGWFGRETVSVQYKSAP